MKTLWNDSQAGKLAGPLALRAYTSRLLGSEADLVLHGGGNTSVKVQAADLFGQIQDLLYVKASGWDLATIEPAGFAAVKLDVLKRMAEIKELSDADMVRMQRAAMTDPYAPNPSVEAILHAIIPFKYVDHTHADAVVAVTNTKDGEKRIREIYGEEIIIIPYVMPGFILARKVYEITQGLNWKEFSGMILMHHGIFTFSDDAKESYEKMIKFVSQAEDYLKQHGAMVEKNRVQPREDLPALASLRRSISKTAGVPMIARLEASPGNVYFSGIPKVSSVAGRGPLTPDHVIRTKRIPVIVGKNPDKDVADYADDYRKYFKRNANGNLVCLDPAPRWAVWPGHGTVSFGRNIKETEIVSDITEHTVNAIQWAEALGGWQALPEKDIFTIEYWELEQAKLKKKGNPPVFQGKVALVSGAASGIGRACVEALHRQGAAVAALDINPEITGLFTQKGILGLVCDVTKETDIKNAVAETIRHFGGLDILVSNAGIFPPSEKISDMKPETWQKSMEINLSSHQLLLKASIPYLTLGMDPAVVFIASKNVPAPGPGASAYSVAKAGLTQLARVAALELASCGIRVNVIHPNQVFDTAIWTPEVLKERAKHYGMTVEGYKTSNLLKVEVTSKDVAALVCAVAGPVFLKTTGAQITIDGGNDRVI